jgi:nanoRNase/pAp phosphatase (c-di-AMP/oligoRNAs hydrolase)
MNPIDGGRLARLQANAGAGPVLILTHDNPDPDALASGAALATLLKTAWGVHSRLVYSGLIARAENRAMLSQLTPEWENENVLSGIGAYSAVALVDSQPGAGNNRLPEEVIPRIVIDHHYPIRAALEQVPYADVRPEIGATVTMLYQHLAAAGITPDVDLATAMFYGLKTDTRGLARGASSVDEGVYMDLLAHLDRNKLIQVEEAGLSQEYYRAFCGGLQAARVHGQTVVAYLGAMHRPDLAAEMADMLIRLEGGRAVLCSGYHAKTLHFSIRTKPLGRDAGLIVQEIVIGSGKAGGHGTMAGGQIPLIGQGVGSVVAEIETRFLTVMGEDEEGKPLIDG